MSELIRKIFRVIVRDGFVVGIRNFSLSVRDRNSAINIINNRRKELSNQLYLEFDGIVHYGLFKGLKLDAESWWSRTDFASMSLGLYEKEILDSLASIPASHRVFVDLGAANGYYTVGVLVNNIFDYSYCYEMSEQGQLRIKSNAIANNVIDKVNIFGKAERDFYVSLQAAGVDTSKCVLLCDIEGGEFDLFDEDMFNIFKGSIIFFEIHEWFFEDGFSKLQKLKRDASHNFKVTELTTGARDLSVFPELNEYSDTDRWLICSEGRFRLMTWLRLDPK